jgi:hypothetical protein
MKKKPDKFQNLFEAFKIPKLRQVELDYLDEYVRIMKPLTEALDTMQNEENMSTGCTLPVINLLKAKMTSFEKDKTFKYCKPLILAVQEAIDRRFGHLFDDHLLRLAALSDLHYKLVWVKESTKDLMMTVLKDEVEKRNYDAQRCT